MPGCPRGGSSFSAGLSLHLQVFCSTGNPPDSRHLDMSLSDVEVSRGSAECSRLGQGGHGVCFHPAVLWGWLAFYFLASGCFNFKRYFAEA